MSLKCPSLLHMAYFRLSGMQSDHLLLDTISSYHDVQNRSRMLTKSEKLTMNSFSAQIGPLQGQLHIIILYAYMKIGKD